MVRLGPKQGEKGIYRGPPVTLAIWGVGHSPDSIGWQLALEAAADQKYGKYIKEIVVANRQDPSLLERTLMCEVPKAAGYNLKLTPTVSDDVERLHSADLVVTLMDANRDFRKNQELFRQEMEAFHRGEIPNEPLAPDRYASLPLNLDGWIRFGLNAQGHKGIILNVGNPLDLGTQTILATSGLPSTKVAGFDLEDPYRVLIAALRELRNLDYKGDLEITDCLIGGPHDPSFVPFTSLMRVNGNLLLPIFSGNDAQLIKNARKYGGEILLNTGKFAPSISTLLLEQIKEILGIDVSGEQTASIYKDGVCHGYPIEVRGPIGDRHIIPRQDFHIGEQGGREEDLRVTRKEEVHSYEQSVRGIHAKMQALHEGRLTIMVPVKRAGEIVRDERGEPVMEEKLLTDRDGRPLKLEYRVDDEQLLAAADAMSREETQREIDRVHDFSSRAVRTLEEKVRVLEERMPASASEQISVQALSSALKSRLLLPCSTSPVLAIYTWDEESQARVQEYRCFITAKEAQGPVERENSALTIKAFDIAGNKVYVLVQRHHSDHSQDHLLFEFDERTGQRSRLLRIKDHEIGAMHSSQGSVYLGMSKAGEPGIYELVDEKLLNRARLAEPAALILQRGKHWTIVSSTNTLYQDDRPIARLQGFTGFARQAGTHTYYTGGDFLKARTEKGEEAARWPCTDYVCDAIPGQVITGIPGGVLVHNYATEISLARQEPQSSYEITDARFDELVRVWIQDEKVFFAATRQAIYGVGHAHGKAYCIARLQNTNHDTIMGELR